MPLDVGVDPQQVDLGRFGDLKLSQVVYLCRKRPADESNEKKVTSPQVDRKYIVCVLFEDLNVWKLYFNIHNLLYHLHLQ